MEGVGSAEPAAPKKPALLKGGMVLCWIYAVLLLLMIAILPLLSAMERAERMKTVATPDVSIVPLESRSQLFIIPLLVLSIIAAYGLAKDRYWSRAMMMALLVLGVVLVPPELASPAIYWSSAGLAGFGWWYLYRKPNVVEYYHAIKQRQLH